MSYDQGELSEDVELQETKHILVGTGLLACWIVALTSNAKKLNLGKSGMSLIDHVTCSTYTVRIPGRGPATLST